MILGKTRGTLWLHHREERSKEDSKYGDLESDFQWNSFISELLFTQLSVENVIIFKGEHSIACLFFINGDLEGDSAFYYIARDPCLEGI